MPRTAEGNPVKKSTYHHYPIFTNRILRAYRRHGMSRAQAQDTLTEMLDSPGFVNSLDGNIVALEHQLKKQGRFVIPDATLSERLPGIRLSSVTGDAWSWPFEFSAISVPTGQRFAGKPCQGIMVAWVNRQDMERVYIPEVVKAHGSRTIPIPSGSVGHMLEIVVPGDADPRIPGGFPTALRQSFLPEEITRFINEAAKYEDNHVREGFMAAMSGEEREYMLEISRYVLSLGMYLSAYPEAITAGVPGYMGNKHPATRQLSRPVFVGVSQERDDALQEALSAPRHVASHWRQLRHERYYQGRYETLPRGTRYVLVSGYSTGADKTVGVEDVEAANG